MISSLFPQQRIVLLDGGSGTTLIDEMGAELDAELWSASLLAHQPSTLARLHRMWEDAGAQIVTSCRYALPRQLDIMVIRRSCLKHQSIVKRQGVDVLRPSRRLFTKQKQKKLGIF